jgi:hypothetical protein
MINVQVYIFCQFNMLAIILWYNQKLSLIGSCYREQIVYQSLIYTKFVYVFLTHPFNFILLLPSLVFLKSPPFYSMSSRIRGISPSDEAKSVLAPNWEFIYLKMVIAWKLV